MSEMHEHNHDENLNAKKAARPNIEMNKNYWLSIDQYLENPEFKKALETEFSSSPLREDKEESWARREFLKLMGASMALSTASCIRRPVQKIVPYNKQPEEVTLGVANYYASQVFDGQENLGVLVKTREGRPLKIEALSSHPINEGGSSIRAQAHVLSLYDPERLKGPKKNLFNEKRTNKDTINVTWEAADKAIVESLAKGNVAILTGPITSPTTRQVVKDFAEGFKATAFHWDVLNDGDLVEAQSQSYGSSTLPYYRFDKADMIVSIDADFLGTWLAPTTFTKQFSKTRKDFSKMSKLVSFDSNFSLTGANADIRIKIKPSQQILVAVAIAQAIIVKEGKSSFASNSSLKEWLNSFGDVTKELSIESSLINEIAKDLWDSKGKSIVVAGGLKTKTAQSVELQKVVNLINSALSNDGETIYGHKGFNRQSSDASLDALIDNLNKGKIKTLIINGVNPVYASSSSLEFSSALKKAEMVIYIGDRNNETTEHAHYILAEHHSLESWGDSDFVEGVYSIQQPVIKPMYDTQSFQLTLMNWCFQAKVGPKRIQEFETYYDYLKNNWKTQIFSSAKKTGDFEKNWIELLQTGFVGQVAQQDSARTFNASSVTSIKKSKASSDFELVLYSTSQLGDGSAAYSNIGWLFELPDPISKVVWDNYASVSLATSKKLNVKEGQIISITLGSKQIDLPVLIQPGLHDGVVAVAVGYGRTRAGAVGDGIGQSVYDFVNKIDDRLVYSGQAIAIQVTKKMYDLAQTQTHHAMEGRQLVVEATLNEYKKKKEHIVHRHPIWSFWSGHQYNGHKWGMAIDLNSCTGCSACMVACQSENNIPVVGKKYVIQGREMHWIRIDRYYTGSPESARAVFQPVMCQHCDNAPCETVCPVLATVHSSEGLNEMVYNRCVGTRYCSNNCPYKVRRFNWFEYSKKIEKPRNLALNPDVTVRTRGVMEKCTFCVHRIKEGKNKAKLDNRTLKDGEIKTACQTACPADAIVFGDMNDPGSQVSKMFKNDRSYALLEEWHAAPSVRYMAKIRNNGEEAMEHGKQGGH